MIPDISSGGWNLDSHKRTFGGGREMPCSTHIFQKQLCPVVLKMPDLESEESEQANQRIVSISGPT